MQAKMPLTFAVLLADWMEAKRVKGPGAARRLGVTSGAVYNWLGGVSLPPTKQAERLAKKLNRPDLVAFIQRERDRNQKRAGGAA
jgi:transcriptional regulator with XRE-family HTH domain